MNSAESNNRYNEVVQTFLSQREKIRDIDHHTAVQREADLLNHLRREFTDEELEKCRLYKELVGSTEDETSAPNLDLPGDIIQNFMNDLAAELELAQKIKYAEIREIFMNSVIGRGISYYHQEILEFIREIKQKYSPKEYAHCMLWHLIIGSTPDESDVRLDLSGGDIEDFIRNKLPLINSEG